MKSTDDENSIEKTSGSGDGTTSRVSLTEEQQMEAVRLLRYAVEELDLYHQSDYGDGSSPSSYEIIDFLESINQWENDQ